MTAEPFTVADESFSIGPIPNLSWTGPTPFAAVYNEILVKDPNYTTAEKNLEIALSETVESETENAVYQQFTLPEKNISFESKKQKPTNFFEEISRAFSSLGSLFGFLN